MMTLPIEKALAAGATAIEGKNPSPIKEKNHDHRIA